MVLGLRTLTDCLRMGGPPFPAACVGAEAAATPTPGLFDLSTAAGTYIPCREGLIGSYTIEIV